MRYATFSSSNHRRRPAVIDGEVIRPLPARIADMSAFIALDPADRARAAAEIEEPVPLGEATLHAPIRPHKNVFCIGRNYLAHAEEGARARGEELKLPAVPTIFTKAPTAIADPGADLHLTGASEKWDWEAELAVVIGTRCKDVDEAHAMGVVFGYTCANDLSARDLQNATTQWFKGKGLDDSCPLGPWIVGAEEIPEPQAVRVALRVNGVEKQSASTGVMIFPIARIIAYLSRGMTLEPGDVIATGTPDGVGFARTPPEFLRDGDVVEVDIDAVGILRNTVRIG